MATINEEIREYADRIVQNTEKPFHYMDRSALIDIDGFDVELLQTKLLSLEEVAQMRKVGAQAFATPDWFGDVVFRQTIEEEIGGGQLNLEASYPLNFLDVRPRSGRFSDKTWVETYGTKNGFGDGVDGDMVWTTSFVTEGAHTLTHLNSRDNPDMQSLINQRFQTYLDSLDGADVNVTYLRGWDDIFTPPEERRQIILGGLSLFGVTIYDQVKPGADGRRRELDDYTDVVALNLHRESTSKRAKGYTLLVPFEGEPKAMKLWGEKIRPASDELLETSLDLLKDAAENAV